MSLEKYHKKRNFNKTSEPVGIEKEKNGQLNFVVQKHEASHLHYDFRIENEGVLKSWAIPKGPSMDPLNKRLAMQVEDHPIDYIDFEGIIPKGNYGAGKVIVWDKGIYYTNPEYDRLKNETEIKKELENGHLHFFLKGKKLKGGFSLVKINKRTLKENNQWLFIKKNDDFANKIIKNEASVITGKLLSDMEVADSKSKDDAVTKLDFSGSKETSMPNNIKPMFAKLADKPFSDPAWLYEVKWDGYRALTYINNKKINILSRSLKSFNSIYPELVEALKNYLYDAVFDGEIIVPDENGISKFQNLQNYKKTREGFLLYYVFDLLYFRGHDIRNLPLFRRREILKKVMPESEMIRFSDDVAGEGINFFKEAEKTSIEGIVAKKKSSIYQQGKRSNDWLKIKIIHQQEAIICGYTEPQGSRKYFGALILGVYHNSELKYIGHTGTGFNEALLKELYNKFQNFITFKSPFKITPKTNSPVTWLRPEIVCEIKFHELTEEEILRHPVFLGLREDKEAKNVLLEKTEVIIPGSQTIEKEFKFEVSNPQKIYWPDEGYTKSDLIDYYQNIAWVILPYIKNRPQSLNRYPDGINGKNFYQKNVDNIPPEWVKTAAFESESENRKIKYIICNNEDILAYLNNLGCVELNVWNSTIQNPKMPDYMVFDLDPVETSIQCVVKVALSIKQLMDELKIPCYCKTSGGRGLHIYVPTGQKYDFDQIKDFAFLLSTLVREKIPKITSLERSPSKRKGLIYLDYLQNRYSATMAAPYCLRPRPHATASAPLEWEEVNYNLDPLKFNIKSMPERVRKKGDLWAGLLNRQIDMGKILDKIKSFYKK